MTARANPPAKRTEALLLAMFLGAEEMAVTGYETCTYPGGVFNDSIWRRNEPENFKLIEQVRASLGLKPFRHRDVKRFGRADDRLVEFRAKERALIAKAFRP